MKFAELKFKDAPTSHYDSTSVRAVHTFPNGYGVSVIRGDTSYGGSVGLYELAVTHNDRLCYDTEITTDVLGHLTPKAVERLMTRVEALPPAAQEKPQ